jgi:aspartate/methionine/tyrosine aminotransferase
VLSRTNIEEIVKFANREELFIFADEVRKKWTTSSSGRLAHKLLHPVFEVQW